MSMPAALLYTIEGAVFIWVAARRAAFRWTIGRALTLQFANGLALLYAVAAMAYLSALRVGQATQEMRRSGQVQEKIWALRGAVDQLDQTVQDAAEASGRTSGRLPDPSGELTAEPALELYAELIRFVGGNPQQAASVGSLREALDRRVDFQREVKGLLETQGIEAVQRLMLTPKARQQRADLYRLVLSVAASERQRALQSESRLYTELERTFGMLPLVAIVGTLVLGYGVIRLSIEMATRESIAKALTLTEARQRLAGPAGRRAA
jgi:CHASE3 domain sensor protein